MIPRLPLAVAAIGLMLAACGSADASATTTSAAPTTTAATTTTAPAPAATTPRPEPTAASTTTTTLMVTTTEPVADGVVIEVTVADGEISGPSRPDVDLGDTVRIIITSDVADEMHVHGYDLFAPLAPGTPVELEFIADIPGIFEVELEEARKLLFDLEVS